MGWAIILVLVQKTPPAKLLQYHYQRCSILTINGTDRIWLISLNISKMIECILPSGTHLLTAQFGLYPSNLVNRPIQPWPRELNFGNESKCPWCQCNLWHNRAPLKLVLVGITPMVGAMHQTNAGGCYWSQLWDCRHSRQCPRSNCHHLLQ